MRLYDTRTGRVEDVVPTRPGFLTVCLAPPADGGATSLGALRTQVLADLIRRTAETRRQRVRVEQAAGPDDDPVRGRVHPGMSPLNVRPPDSRNDGTTSAAVDVVTTVAGARDPFVDTASGHLARTGPVTFHGRTPAPDAGAEVLRAMVDRGRDPLALRLAYLEHHYRAPVDLTWESLDGADERLRHWRDRVAHWAESPSRAMPPGYVDEITAAFDDDLDTPRALSLLRRVERNPDVAAGARFETFAHLDRLFGLDLARDVGRPRPTS